MKAKSESTAKRSKEVSAETKKTTAAKAVKKAVKKAVSPREDEIRAKAEELYRERIAKNLPGTQENDWLRAEKILRGIK
ncbi:MAG TPA: hypothetical protein DDW27_06730 [Bacteroidales bacterium]|nr:hypothetical protein [Bacteroidales bacterium]